MAQSRIRFKAKISEGILALPKNASADIPAGDVNVEGIINTFPFRTTVKEKGSLKVSKALQDAAHAKNGDTVEVELTRVGDRPETLVPAELGKALASDAKAKRLWSEITPMARREWILWIGSGKQEVTRSIRIKKACDMLSHGKRRVCCFGGINWLTKDHPSAGTWTKLPKSRE